MDALKAKNQSSVAELFKESDFVLSMTNGIISRAVPDQASKIWWVTHNADIHQGNSGGPLCLSNGVVAAINTQMINDPDAANPLPTYYSFTMAQLKTEASRWTPGVKWVKP